MNKLLYFLLSIYLFPCITYSFDLGTMGATYPIIEKDLLTVIEERAKSVDWKKHIENAQEEARANVGKISRPLPKAEKDSIRYIDLTTKLEHPIYVRDKQGKPKLLYPKGYTFNPLEYLSIKQRYFYFDATRPEELKYFNDNFADDLTVLPIITNGNALELGKKYKREVYFIDDEQIKKFQIKVTPTLIYQNNKVLEAKEIYLKPLKDIKEDNKKEQRK